MPTPSRQAASAPSAWCRITTRLRTTVACEARLVGRSVLRHVPLRCVCAQVLVAAAKGQEGCDDGRLATAPALVPRARRAQRSGRFGSGCGELGSVAESALNEAVLKAHVNEPTGSAPVGLGGTEHTGRPDTEWGLGDRPGKAVPTASARIMAEWAHRLSEHGPTAGTTECRPVRPAASSPS